MPVLAREPGAPCPCSITAVSSHVAGDHSQLSMASGPESDGSAVLATDLLKPESDTRQYRLISLPNGMNALLISDPTIGGKASQKMQEPSGCWPCRRRAPADEDEANDEEAATKKAACALSVGVGYLSDPSELQGCAHYVEHMLFMGTGKYPKENGWSTFLSRHGGLDNGETFAEATVFYFVTGGSEPMQLSQFMFYAIPDVHRGRHVHIYAPG